MFTWQRELTNTPVYRKQAFLLASGKKLHELKQKKWMATHTLCCTKVSLSSYTHHFYYSNQRKVNIRTLLSMNTEYKHYLAETLTELSIVLLFLWAAAAAASDTLSFCLSLFKCYSGLGCMGSLIRHISLNIQTTILLVSGRNILSDKQPMLFHSLVILHLNSAILPCLFCVPSYLVLAKLSPSSSNTQSTSANVGMAGVSAGTSTQPWGL